MNSSGDDTEPAREILYLNFNQTSTTLTAGSKNGYMIYDLDQVYECNPTYESRNVSDVCIIERNYTSSLVAYVSLHSPRTLIFYNYAKGAIIKNRPFPNTVLAVKLNREYIAVCLEDRIFIITLKNLNDDQMYEITNIPLNEKGLCAMTSRDSPTLLAYPASTATGNVQIFDASEKKEKTTIPAHESALAALAFDESGEKIATASVKGTVFRVFSVEDNRILFEFRRGMKRNAEICCLSFDISSQFLCACSDTDTVHVFKLCHEEPVQSYDEESEGWMDMFGRVVSQGVKYLPTQMTDVLNQRRSFAYVRLPFYEKKKVCTISVIKNQTYVMVASLEGFLYIFELNTEIGGDCQLIKQHRIEGPLRPTQPPCSCFAAKEIVEIRTVEDTGKQESQRYANCLYDNKYEDETANVANQIDTVHDELPPILNTVE